MSVGTSNIMFSSSSSSSSSSSATKIGKLIEKFNQTTIKTFVIGISKLKFHWLDKDISHAALLLSDKKRSLLETNVNEEGILIEFGFYPPEKDEAKKEEEGFIKDGLVIYRYGKDEGGLRYYTNTFKEFKNKFCDIGYISLNVHKDFQKTFSNLIDIIAPISEKKWIKKNYLAVGGLFFGKQLNCQSFVCHSIDVMKPTYESIYIVKGKESSSVSDEKKESVIPEEIIKTLKKYED